VIEPESHHQEAFDQLAGMLIDLAIRFLEVQGSFAPFGAFIARDAKLHQLPCDAEIGEPNKAMFALAVKIRAADSDVGMIVLDTRARTPQGEITDAIFFIGEHREGPRVAGYLPYKLRGNEVDIAEHFLEPDPPAVIFG
jgi:hypothetical protein